MAGAFGLPCGVYSRARSCCGPIAVSMGKLKSWVVTGSRQVARDPRRRLARHLAQHHDHLQVRLCGRPRQAAEDHDSHSENRQKALSHRLCLRP